MARNGYDEKVLRRRERDARREDKKYQREVDKPWDVYFKGDSRRDERDAVHAERETYARLCRLRELVPTLVCRLCRRYVDEIRLWCIAEKDAICRSCQTRFRGIAKTGTYSIPLKEAVFDAEERYCVDVDRLEKYAALSTLVHHHSALKHSDYSAVRKLRYDLRHRVPQLPSVVDGLRSAYTLVTGGDDFPRRVVYVVGYRYVPRAGVLRTHREAASVSQRAFAKLSHVSLGHIKRLESVACAPQTTSAKIALRILAALAVRGVVTEDKT